MVAIYVNELDAVKLKFNVTYQAGKVDRVREAIERSGLSRAGIFFPEPNVAYPPRGYRILYQMSQIGNTLGAHQNGD
jgi:hypothetical protein